MGHCLDQERQRSLVSQKTLQRRAREALSWVHMAQREQSQGKKDVTQGVQTLALQRVPLITEERAGKKQGNRFFGHWWFFICQKKGESRKGKTQGLKRGEVGEFYAMKKISPKQTEGG